MAESWVVPFENGRSLMRTKYWLVKLDPDAGEALRIAALTHDVERNFLGGPAQPANLPANDRKYRDPHQARSAELVTKWLLEHKANPAFIQEVGGPRRVPEGGRPPPPPPPPAAASPPVFPTTPP